jgi:8-oxo-dGTP diphosphatase
MSTQNRPKVGVGVCIIKDGKVLLGERLGSHGENTWSFPGGHLEYGETFVECALREVSEEVGLEIGELTFVTATNDVFEVEGEHYVTIYIQAAWLSG